MESEKDPFLGIDIDGYVLEERCGAGAVGAVYRGVKNDKISDTRAIKLIADQDLRPSWVQEINKTTQIQNYAPVISYIDYGKIQNCGTSYTWIAWRFVDGQSVREAIDTKQITLPLLRDIINNVLAVLHACGDTGIQHGDLHCGNIMIEAPNSMSIESGNKVLVTDFGYLTASQGETMLDDFQGLSIIIRDAIESINFHKLEGRDKGIIRKLKEQNQLLLLDADVTEHEYARIPSKLKQEFEKIFNFDPSNIAESNHSISDYLAAEILGENYDEWQALFVPDIIGADRLVERNTTVLTGLRGCGKTMVFRRLSAHMNIRLGEVAQIPGADSFVGFYFNARNVAEAFPWLPESKKEEAQQQILHFFHSCWIIEIIEWLILSSSKNESFDWLISFFRNLFGELVITSTDVYGLRQLKTFFEKQRERARLKASFESTGWQLNSVGLLDEISRKTIEAKGLTNQPFYFFLDDYSTPLVTKVIQQILNAVVFRRGAESVFKIATESTESLEYVGLNDKVLELDDDFSLIDSAFESLQEHRKKKNRELLNSILSKRILRDQGICEYGTSLLEVLGRTPNSYNELAKIRRKGASKKKLNYSGEKIFCDIWSSNTREIIRLFTDIVRTGDPASFKESSEKNQPLISPSNQNDVLRAAGGKYREVLRGASNPTKSLWELGPQSGDESFGDKLVSIADAFSEIALFELLNKDIKNGKNHFPKQARRIELTDAKSSSLPEDLVPIYQGLIRYGVFLSDSRAKSARGKAVDRLVLRGILVPYYTISFSKHDSISISLDQFTQLLRSPDKFAKAWKKSKTENDEGPDLFEI